MKKIIALGIIALSLAGTASAQVKPEEQIKYRQAGYSFMSWNMGKIKANLEGEYNTQQVQAAANAVAAIAGSGMGALYGPGTDKDIGEVNALMLDARSMEWSALQVRRDPHCAACAGVGVV